MPNLDVSAACVIQITDCHLLAEQGQRLGDWDNWAALEAILEAIRHDQPTPAALLLTGDLVHDESVRGYQRLAQRLHVLDIPIYAVAGNHDDPSLMTLHMPCIQVGGMAQVGAWQIALLNSHTGTSDSGVVGQAQLQDLQSRLHATPDTPTLVAVHHPPTTVGSPWIDALGLQDSDELLESLNCHAHVKAVVSGHVHQEYETLVNGLTVLTTPAVTRQFMPASVDYAEDTQHVPGYRCLYLSETGALRSEVHRVAQARVAGLKG